MVNYLLATLSGLLLWGGFAPLEVWFTPILGIALLFQTLCGKTILERFILSLLAGLSFFLPLLHWSSIYVGSVPWLVLAFGQSLLFCLIAIPNWSRTSANALQFSALFTLIELLRMKIPFGGFGWGRLGFTQIDSLTFAYPLVGVTGVSLLVAFSTLMVTSIRSFLLAATFLFLMQVNPFFRPNIPEAKFIQVTAIQGGVDKLGLDFNQRATRILKRHIDETHFIQGTDLYIWPENASDIDPIKNKEARKEIVNLSKRIKAPLLVGAVESSPEGPTNSSLLFDSNGELVSRYIKQDLAPFGEYMPLRKLAEIISPYAERVNDFRPGSDWVKHSVNGIPFQALICFEVLDDDHVKTGALGSAFLVAQTNNATFGKSSEAAQQFQITRARAAELAREFAVVSTTGLTAHLNQHGEILDRAPQFEPRRLTMNIHLEDPEKKTPAQRTTSWMWLIALFAIMVLPRMRISR